MHFQGTCQGMPHLGVMNTGFCSIASSLILLIPWSAEAIRRYQALLAQCLSVRMQNPICFQVLFPTKSPLQIWENPRGHLERMSCTCLKHSSGAFPSWEPGECAPLTV